MYRNIKRLFISGLVLTVVLVSSLLAVFVCSVPVLAQDVNPTRTLPAQVVAGQQFDVVVTFTSPNTHFNAVGLTDVVPVGWTVAVNTSWTTPMAMASHTPAQNEAVYVWSGPLNNPSWPAVGGLFVAIYKVQVPADVAIGFYELLGELEYYISDTGPYVSAVEPSQIEVVLSQGGGSAAHSNVRLPVLVLFIIGAVIVGAWIVKAKRDEKH